MRAPFRYYGGKANLAKRIAAKIPPHTVYVEPFAGSAAVLFAKPLLPKQPGFYKEVINDTNHAVVEIFRALRNHPDEFKDRLNFMPYSKAEHARAWEIYNGREHEANPVERAALFMLLFSGSMAGNAGPTQVGTPNGVVGAHAGTWDRKRALLDAWVARMARVFVSDKDALTIVKQWDSPTTFFYCDPPYPNTNQGHYGGWGEDDTGNLLVELANTQGSFILSGYPHPLIDGFAQALGWGVWDHQTSTTASLKGTTKNKRTERFWYRSNTATPNTAQARYLAKTMALFTGDLTQPQQDTATQGRRAAGGCHG